MFLNKNTAVKVVNTAKKPIKCYSFREMYKSLPSDDYGTDVQKSLENKGYKLIADNGNVKTFSGIPGYAYAVLIELAETNYLIFIETEPSYITWMRKFSMIAHLIERFLPTQ